MKKVFVLFFAPLLSVCTYNNVIIAQDGPDSNATETVDTPETSVETIPQAEELPKIEEAEVERSAHQKIKKNFIDGGWQFMAIVLVCLILGLAIAKNLKSFL